MESHLICPIIKFKLSNADSPTFSVEFGNLFRSVWQISLIFDWWKAVIKLLSPTIQ